MRNIPRRSAMNRGCSFCRAPAATWRTGNSGICRDYFRAGDVLVLNNSRVIPARLRGTNARTGGQFEMLLLEENARNDWWAMLRPGKRARPGTQIVCVAPDGTATAVRATVVETNDAGHRRLHFSGTPDIRSELDRLGEVPLPPYIQRGQPGRGGPGALSDGLCAGCRLRGRANGGPAFYAGIAGANPGAGRERSASSRCTSAPARFSR